MNRTDTNIFCLGQLKSYAFWLPFSAALFWVNSVYMDAEGSSVTVTVVREGYHGRSADVVGE